MKKIFLFLSFLSLAFSQNEFFITDFDNELKPKIEVKQNYQDDFIYHSIIFDIVDGIIEVYTNLEILNSRKLDENSSIYKDDKNYLLNQSKDLLFAFPVALLNSQDSSNQKVIELLANEISLLQKNIDKMEKSLKKNDFEFFSLKINLKNTILRTNSGSLLFIPNSKIIDKNIENLSRRNSSRKIKFTLSILYNSDKKALQKAIKQIKQMLVENENILKPQDTKNLMNFENLVLDKDIAIKNSIFVNFYSLENSSLDILVSCYTKIYLSTKFYDFQQEILLKSMQIIQNNGLIFANDAQIIDVRTFPMKEKCEN